MNIYISTDIEGIGCVVRSEHSAVQGREYERARHFMTEEVNAAIKGAFDAGASSVTVCDSHNVGLNLLPEQVDERAELIMGSPRPLSMMEGIDGGYDAVFFVGYHAMAGTADSPIVHIFTGRIAALKINGVQMGEIGLNALLAGYYGVPVVLVSSDAAGVREAEGLLETVETVCVKTGIGAYAARCLHPKRCRALIHEGAKAALRRLERFEPFVMEGPARLEVRLTTTSGADRACRLPGARRTGPCDLIWEGKDLLETFQAFNTIADLVEMVAFI